MLWADLLPLVQEAFKCMEVETKPSHFTTKCVVNWENGPFQTDQQMSCGLNSIKKPLEISITAKFKGVEQAERVKASKWLQEMF